MIKSIFDSYGTPILIGIFIGLMIIETRFQLRKRVQGRWKRVVINFIVSIPAFVLLRLLLIPGLMWVATKNQHWQFGFCYLFDSPVIITSVIAFVLLDYSNYIWHILLHKLPFYGAFIWYIIPILIWT